MKKIFLISLLSLIFSTMIFSNPFFSGNPASILEKESLDKETENKIQERKEPSPVLVGKTTKGMIEAQGNLREKIATFFKSLKTSTGSERNKILWSIAGIAFIYGMIHAAGPGHRKTIVFSLYIARKAPWYEPLITGFILAALHGGAAILLMLIFKGVSGSISAHTNSFTIYMEGFSYGLIIILAVIMIIKETIEFVKNKKSNTKTEILNEETNIKNLIPFLISGLYPCPGAILVLVLSFTLDILGTGIFSVIIMSLGMAVPITLVAYLAWFGRRGIFTALKNKTNLISTISYTFEIIGYSFLLLFSIYISLPFFVSLF